ncbi:MAG: HDOD domain-containing protein [Syntrophaceae bacterium]|nr:HDOD domain-containing protein [Syntrophaceae bacterium]
MDPRCHECQGHRTDRQFPRQDPDAAGHLLQAGQAAAVPRRDDRGREQHHLRGPGHRRQGPEIRQLRLLRVPAARRQPAAGHRHPRVQHDQESRLRHVRLRHVPGHGNRGAFDKKNFWKHCIGCAVASRVLAEAADLRNPDEVFTGGLLHDIGKLVVAVHYPDRFSAVINEVQASGAPMVESERKVFGYDHCQVGSALAAQWRFPADTAQMIGAHHLADGALPARKDIAAVHIGNILAMALGLGSGGEKKLAPVNPKAWDLLGLSLSSLELVMEKTVKLYRENTEILEM